MSPPGLLTHRRYLAREELGRGAQGVVLRVVDREQPELALVAKLWRPGAFDAATLRGEFELLRRLAVPGLVRAHDFAFDEVTQAPFLVEDFVAGAEAAPWIHVEPRLRAERLSRVLVDTAITLGALHDAAFAYGDLKPAHVRVGPGERMLLLDLGAAVARAEERAAGFTPAFAAPEVRAGARGGPSADLYGLGALGWAIACGATPGGKSSGLRALAPWVPPSLSQVIEQLLAEHPRDRPASAEHVVRMLGLSGLPAASRGAPAPVGRDRELAVLLEPRAGVRYVSGASSTGKSQLVREVMTRALASGRTARRVVFPSDDQRLVARLIAFFRGASGAWPFTAPAAGDEGLPLLVLDDLHAAPSELVLALDAFRCREADTAELDVLATLREAPEGAPGVVLGPLNEEVFGVMCRALGVSEPAEIVGLSRMTERNPGFLVAARGRVPLSRDAAVARARSLSAGAVALLASVALLGGVATEDQLRRAQLEAPHLAAAELLGAGLLTRRQVEGHVCFALQVPELSSELAAALGSFELTERLSRCLLADEAAPARALLALAGGPFPPTARGALLERAAEGARREGLSGEELEALLALAAEPACRSRALVLRLERLTRSAGQSHAGVLEWLEQAAAGDATLVPLLRRRQAERAARAGDLEGAERLAQEALSAAQALGDRAAEGLALGTCGAVALYRADVAGAEKALRDAALTLATSELDDPEEQARLDHNAGVVALYVDRIDDAVSALERSLALKRRLGDRAGVRACLLNLGLALSRRGDYAAAAASLDEAVALAQSLRQPTGRAWCLAARADVEVRRRDAVAAERFIAEAEAIAEAPPMVRADLTILRAQVALQMGDAVTAKATLQGLDPALCAKDAMLDARARLVEAGVLLASLPAEPRRAARLCIAVVRAARAARLSEVEGQALELLRVARRERAKAAEPRYAGAMLDAGPELWSWLSEVAAGAQAADASLSLLRWARRATGAERALFIQASAQGVARAAWGVDSEDFELSSVLERLDRELLRSVVESREPLYQRDMAFSSGRGSRLSVSHGAGDELAVLVLEHRFKLGAFDGVEREQARRFATLCGVALRLTGPRDAAAPEARVVRPAPLAEAANAGETTMLPLGRARRSFPGIVGKSRALGLALAKLDAAIGSNLPVLIVGETGTGKELFARALHELGDRSRGPLVAVNCAAIADSLFEAELFGHARGAFTGADRARPGLLARAEGGTLFLDEVGELPLARQASLLRVLETRRYRPVGSDEERAFDVHLVAATNRPLEEAVAQGQFRSDLLYRLNVIEISVPPLRERTEDVSLLVRSFVERAGSSAVIAPAVMSALEAYHWPGNVRELEHHVQRLLALGVPRIERAHLPRALRQAGSDAAEASATALTGPFDPRAQLEQALRAAGGNITHAARALGLTRHGLKKRMLRLGLRTQAGGG